MPWQYHQSSGQLTFNGLPVGTGYSGMAAGRNNPAMEHVGHVGPIPRGRYRIGPQTTHPSKGRLTMPLSPMGHSALGRTHFLIHGDSTRHPGQASEGCIVLDRTTRHTIATSADTVLEVLQ